MKFLLLVAFFGLQSIRVLTSDSSRTQFRDTVPWKVIPVRVEPDVCADVVVRVVELVHVVVLVVARQTVCYLVLLPWYVLELEVESSHVLDPTDLTVVRLCYVLAELERL